MTHVAVECDLAKLLELALAMTGCKPSRVEVTSEVIRIDPNPSGELL